MNRRPRRPDPSVSPQQLHGIIAWLRSHMQARRLTARALGGRAGLHPSTLSRILRGECAPTWATVQRLALVLGDDPPGHPSARTPPATTAVLQALAADPILTGQDRRDILRYYLAERRGPGSGKGVV